MNAGFHEFSSKSDKMNAERKPKPQTLPQDAPPMRIVESTEIFRGHNEIVIRHDGILYRMKITRQGKLILNK